MNIKDENCHLVKQKLPSLKKELKVNIPLSVPVVVEHLLERAEPSEIPGLLYEIIKDIDFDRMKDKLLASKLAERWEDLETVPKDPTRCLNDTQISLSVTAHKVKTTLSPFTNHTH